MKSLHALIFSVFLILQAACGAQVPNIVVVLVDDLGWGDFSCFGNKDARTPNLDRLAAGGIRFTQFYVNSPICSPSRCALTTGQYPQRWRITSFLNNRADNARRGVANWLDPKATTLPQLLKNAGYATGHFGKWHLGGQRDVDNAPAIASYGFDESLTNFEGMGAKLLPLTLKPGAKEPGRIWADAERLGGPVKWLQRSEITGGFVDGAIRFMEKSAAAKKPFFINVWPDDVHSPFWPPVDQWKEGKRGLYHAVLESMDRQLGRLFEFINDRPELRENTLVLVFSDNGPEPGAGSAGPFRGSKATIFEGGTRSPFIVWGPGLQEKSMAGTENRESVFAAFDLVPSILSIAKVAVPEHVQFDGESLAPVLLGKAFVSRKKPLFWRRPPDRKTAYGAGNLPDLGMRDGNWKLYCNFDGANATLFDLGKDPGEEKDLASEKTEIVGRLTRELLEWNRSMPQDKGAALMGPSESAAPKR